MEGEVGRLIGELKLAQEAVEDASTRQTNASISEEKAKARLLTVNANERSKAIAAFALANTEYRNATEVWFAGTTFVRELEAEIVGLVTKNTTVNDGKSGFGALMCQKRKDACENSEEITKEYSDDESISSGTNDNEKRDFFHKGKVCHICGTRGRCCDCCKHPDH